MATPRQFNLTVSQSPAPRGSLYLLGCELQEVYSVVPITQGHALAIGMLRYRQELFFGCYADPDALAGGPSAPRTESRPSCSSSAARRRRRPPAMRGSLSAEDADVASKGCPAGHRWSTAHAPIPGRSERGRTQRPDDRCGRTPGALAYHALASASSVGSERPGTALPDDRTSSRATACGSVWARPHPVGKSGSGDPKGIVDRDGTRHVDLASCDESGAWLRSDLGSARQ